MSEILDEKQIKFNQFLVSKLKLAYGQDTWKYQFQKNANKFYGFSVQYRQLNHFEQGGRCRSDLIMVFIAEIERCNPGLDFTSEMGSNGGISKTQIKNLQKAFSIVDMEMKLEKAELLAKFYELIKD